MARKDCANSCLCSAEAVIVMNKTICCWTISLNPFCASSGRNLLMEHDIFVLRFWYCFVCFEQTLLKDEPLSGGVVLRYKSHWLQKSTRDMVEGCARGFCLWGLFFIIQTNLLGVRIFVLSSKSKRRNSLWPPHGTTVWSNVMPWGPQELFDTVNNRNFKCIFGNIRSDFLVARQSWTQKTSCVAEGKQQSRRITHVVRATSTLRQSQQWGFVIQCEECPRLSSHWEASLNAQHWGWRSRELQL